LNKSILLADCNFWGYFKLPSKPSEMQPFQSNSNLPPKEKHTVHFSTVTESSCKELSKFLKLEKNIRFLSAESELAPPYTIKFTEKHGFKTQEVSLVNIKINT
jgi:hypothetical protein